MRYVLLVAMTLLAGSIAGCHSAESSSEVSALPYDGPPVTLEVMQRDSRPPTSEAMVTVTVPSGGWRLIFDQSRIRHDVAILELTLERPGDGEMVTQAMQTLTRQCLSADPRFTRAEAWVRLLKRGEEASESEYRLAASAGP
jgi:hypothetical protein